MRKTTAVLMATAAALVLSAGRLSAQVQVGLSVSDGQVRNFSLAIGDYYQVPEREVVVVRERGIPEEEVPVVYFIARHSHYQPDAIIRMRLRGESWAQVSDDCGVPRDAYVVEGVSGPPYGNAYGYYKHHPRRVVYDDEAIVRSVNVRFLADRYNCAPAEVVRMRGNGRSFVALNDDFRAHREGHDRDDRHEQEHGHDHGRGHGRHKDR